MIGLLLGYISSNQLLARLGIFIGRGAICPLIIVLFVLPELLIVFLSVLPAAAACDGTNTKKEEVVYVNLNGDGSVKESTIRLMNF